MSVLTLGLALARIGSVAGSAIGTIAAVAPLMAAWWPWLVLAVAVVVLSTAGATLALVLAGAGRAAR